jgi:MFS family permease
METALSSTIHEKEKPETSASEAVNRGVPRRSWSPLDALLRLRAFEAIRYREFRLIWLGQIFVSIGTWMDQVARGWLIYELTNSKFQLGLVQGIQAIPLLLLSPVAGSTADRYSRKMQLVTTQVGDGLLYATLALLIFTDRIQPWHVYATAFAMTSLQSFQHPSRVALIADSVPSSNLTNAIGLNAVAYNVARILGPVLAGLLIAMFGTGGSYTIQAVLYFLATVWTGQLRPTQRSSGRLHGHPAQGDSFGKSIIEGWKFSWRNEAVRAALLIAILASLFIAPFVTLLPVFARDLLEVGATGQGLLLTAMGLGALSSAFLLASLGDKLPRGIIMIGGVGLYGLIVVAFSASSWFELSMVLMAIMGLCHLTSHALVQTVIQAYSPSEFRGRTSAIFHMTRIVLMVGSMLIGALSAIIGARGAVSLMGMTGVLTIVAIYVALPRARLIR